MLENQPHICDMSDSTILYEGKAKILYSRDSGTLIQCFKDSATAFNNQKQAQIKDKGVLNSAISEYFMLRLGEHGIATHFISRLDARCQLIRKLDIIGIEVIVRNRCAGTLCSRFGREEGEILPSPLIEYCLKDDALGDPPMSVSHIYSFGLAEAEEMWQIESLAFRINDYLSGLLRGCGLILVDFKLEFGRDAEGEIILADEITPDTCRLWDVASLEKMDKDRFRQDLGGVTEAYRAVAARLGIVL